MSAFLQSLLGGKAKQQPINPAEDADFADFAGAPDPSPASSLYNSAASSLSVAASPTAGAGAQIPYRPYTKWYRVWERVTLADFYSELFILPFIIIVVCVHLWGSRKNRRKARAWITAHGPVLEQEYALVGFQKLPKTSDETPSATSGPSDPFDLLKEKTITEYTTYATGRQNVAFTDIKVTLSRRHNPMGWFGEEALGFFFESQPAPREGMQATTYTFDGRENDLAPLLNSKVGANGQVTETKSSHKEKSHSSYDGFVFAIVHKDLMKRLRDERYDLSLTSTKDHQKLPLWATTMSESAEVTETMLTAEMIKAVEQAGDALESLIVTDMPIDSPRKLNDLVPRKRISLSLRLQQDPSSTTLPLFRLFLRLPDLLASNAHFRPEALRRVRTTRDDEVRKIKKVFDAEDAEKRRTQMEKDKKKDRDAKLRGLSAEEQRKLLEKERATDLRKGQKKRSMKG